MLSQKRRDIHEGYSHNNRLADWNPNPGLQGVSPGVHSKPLYWSNWQRMGTLTVRLLTTPIVNQKMHYCNAMILRLSVTLMDKINIAKPDALLFADGQGIFNRQFFSLMLMTNYLIGIKSNSLEKRPNTIACHESEIVLDNCPWH